MKTNLTALFMLLGIVMQAQISITHSDFNSAFAPGSSFKSYMTPLGGEPVTVFVGEPSAAAQYWDFSGFTFNYAAHSTGINPSNAPLISTWPDANLVLYEKSWIDRADTMYVYNYKELTVDLLTLHGVSDESSVLFEYSPPVTQSVVPLDYGSNWSRQRDSTFIMEGYWIISEGIVTADAFGTLKIPSGEYECLRLQQKNITTTHTPIGTTTSETRSYHFYTKGMAEVNLPAILENQFNLSTIEISGFKYSVKDGQAGVFQEHSSQSGICIEEIFPNPLSGEGTVQFTTTHSIEIEIDLFDLNGKKIMTLYSGKPSPGSYTTRCDFSGLRPGVYICQMTGHGQPTSQLLLIRK